MPSCSVLGCNNNNHKSRILSKNQIRKNILFHGFPLDLNRKLLWTKALRRVNWLPRRDSHVCSAHFVPNDYIFRPSCDPKLKDNAVPSVFSPIIKEKLLLQLNDNKTRNTLRTRNNTLRTGNTRFRKGKCFVKNCNVSYRNQNDTVTLFNVPADLSRRLIWQQHIQHPNQELQRCDVVCERHFEEDAMIRYREIQNRKYYYERPRLKPGAVPTIFSDSSKASMKILRSDEIKQELEGPIVISEDTNNFASTLILENTVINYGEFQTETTNEDNCLGLTEVKIEESHEILPESPDCSKSEESQLILPENSNSSKSEESINIKPNSSKSDEKPDIFSSITKENLETYVILSENSNSCESEESINIIPNSSKSDEKPDKISSITKENLESYVILSEDSNSSESEESFNIIPNCSKSGENPDCKAIFSSITKENLEPLNWGFHVTKDGCDSCVILSLIKLSKIGPYIYKSLVIKENLSCIKYYLNKKIEVMNVTSLEEIKNLLRSMEKENICRGGPKISIFKPLNSRTAFEDTRVNVWRSMNCPILSRQQLRCKKCMGLSERWTQQLNKRKQSYKRKLVTAVNPNTYANGNHFQQFVSRAQVTMCNKATGLIKGVKK